MLVDDPLQECARDELGIIVGAKMEQRAAFADRTRQYLNHTVTCPRVFVPSIS